jgi:hypothetical protein
LDCARIVAWPLLLEILTGAAMDKQALEMLPDDYLSKVRPETILKTGFLGFNLCYAKNTV